MKTRAALGAATALALTATGGVSALFLTVGQASGADAQPVSAEQVVTVEYVDQFGNPIEAPLVPAQASGPEVILINPDGTVVGAPVAAAAEDQVPSEEQVVDYHQEDDEYQEVEYDDQDEDEDGDEDEVNGEYAVIKAVTDHGQAGVGHD